MNQIAETSVPSSTARDTGITRYLYTLALALGLGGVAVWQLRQEWAKASAWPWLVLLFAMFYAAGALRQLNLWLPGEAILPSLAKYSTRTFVILGAIFITGSLALTWLIVRKLLPNYQSLWHGTPLLWLASMILIVGGAWLLGAVGRGAPRAATASTLWSNSNRSRWLEAAAVALILALAIFLRTYRFTSIPPGIYVDETNGAMDALRILEGSAASPFGTGWYGTPNGYIYYMAGIIKVLGATWTSLKLISLIPAILSILAIYFLGRLVFGPLAGLSAMLLMASSRWHMSMSRWGWNETAPPLFQILATFFLIRGLRDRRALDYVLSGLLVGLSMYTYLSARLAAATLLLYILLWVLTDRSGVVASLRRSWLGFVLFALAALVAVAPLAVTYYTDPFTMNNRVSEISVFRDIREQNSIQPLVQNVKDILKFFHQTGDHQGKHNLPDEPMTDPITGLLFAVGLAYSLLHWRDQRYFLLLMWLVIGLAGSFLSSHSESPQSYRALTALPAVVLMAADILDRVVRTIYKALQGQSFARSHPRLPMYIAGAIGVLALLGSTAWESNVYFGRQASSVAVQQGFNPTENQVAREVIAALQSNKDVYLSPRFAEFSPLRFLVYGVMKARTGENTLDNRPYHTLLPATDLPVKDNGRDVLILLDSSFWPLRDYIQFFYPQAKMGLITLSDGSPVYFKIEIPHEQLAALQGLNETVAHPDGSTEQRLATQVKVDDQKAAQITWEGAIQIEHGGTYEVKGEGGLDVFLDDLPVSGPQYLGRGLYDLKAIWNAGDNPDAHLTWRRQDGEWASIPAGALFRTPGQRQGLLGVYWNNTNWENTPVFHQITPFLMLAWNDEQPIVPNGPFSARYNGSLKITEPGTYSFRVEADDGARLIIDDQVIGEGVTPGQPNSFDASVDLTAGEHPIRVEYFQQGGGSALRVFWSFNGQPYTPLPPSVLTPAKP
ncbi:MAG: PA14 domain-containing protein [Bacteroidota bacterium]